MRASCSMVWARFRHSRRATSSVPDSISQTTTLITARARSWPIWLSMPSARPTMESPWFTTTSTAAPISSSGITSATLFSTAKTVAAISVRRWPLL